MNSPDKGPPAIESLGNNPAEELNDATLTRIIQDLYSQTPKDIPDLDPSEEGTPEDSTTDASDSSEGMTHGMGRPTMPEMTQINEFSQLSNPGIPDISQVEGVIPTGELRKEGGGDAGALPSPHAPEDMMMSAGGMDELGTEPDASTAGEMVDGDMGTTTSMDTTGSPEPISFESFNPYFITQQPTSGPPAGPADMPDSEATPPDRNQLGALQSPYASEGMLKGVRNNDDLPGGKQMPTGMESEASPAETAEEVGTTQAPFDLSGMSLGGLESPGFAMPTGENQQPSPNDVEAYLDVDNLKKITEGFSFDIPALFPEDDPASATIRERMDPQGEHPIAEGLAQTFIKPFAPTVDTNISSYYGNEGDTAADEQGKSTDGDRPIKEDFPALNQNVHGKPLIWLDSAATSQKPYDVIEKVREFYHRDNSNVHRGAHTLAARSTNAYEEAREKVQAFIKAESKKEIVFVRGATEAINLVAQSYGRKNIGRGDEILVTEMEHHSNIVPWQFLAQEKGARIKVAPFTDVGELDLEVFGRLLNDRTKIVAFTHVSNSLGTINPVRQMTEMAHRHGAKVLIDGCQSLPHMPVRVSDINCDFLAFSGHKLYGPTGIGVLYGKRELLETMPPWQGGGMMITDVTFEKTVFSDIPTKFEAGTGNIADAVGLGAAIDYLSKIGMENVERFEHELVQYSMNALGSIPGLRLIGTAPNKAGAISFLIEGLDPAEIGTFLDHEGIAVRTGHHCAQPAVRHFGVESTVRPSLGIYNTKSDIDELVKALYKAKKSLK
jgi:cysteine desulfurase / selenocysteine lyase